MRPALIGLVLGVLASLGCDGDPGTSTFGGKCGMPKVQAETTGDRRYRLTITLSTPGTITLSIQGGSVATVPTEKRTVWVFEIGGTGPTTTVKITGLQDSDKGSCTIMTDDVNFQSDGGFIEPETGADAAKDAPGG